jgi:hypothetical protein
MIDGSAIGFDQPSTPTARRRSAHGAIEVLRAVADGLDDFAISRHA